MLDELRPTLRNSRVLTVTPLHSDLYLCEYPGLSSEILDPQNQ